MRGRVSNLVSKAGHSAVPSPEAFRRYFPFPQRADPSPCDRACGVHCPPRPAARIVLRLRNLGRVVERVRGEGVSAATGRAWQIAALGPASPFRARQPASHESTRVGRIGQMEDCGRGTNERVYRGFARRTNAASSGLSLRSEILFFFFLVKDSP